MKSTKPKPAKPKIELRQSAQPLSDRGPLDPQHPAALIFAEVKRAEAAQVATAELASSVDTPASPDTVATLARESSLDTLASPDTSERDALPMAGPDTVASPATQAKPEQNIASFAEAISYGKGHVRLNHDYFDQVITLLNENEQLLFIHLLRYREGLNDYTIRLNFPLLERRTHLSARTLSRAAASMEQKGLVARFDYQFGKGTRQGFRFRIVMPASLVRVASPVTMARLDTVADSNKEVLKENNKKDDALARDTRNCPDCRGTGFYYPEGVEQGVAKCFHKRLTT